MKRCNPLSAVVISFLCLAGSSWAADREEPASPNIVFIMADDLGPGWVDFDGSSPEINTPNLERLAESGMVFTRAYANPEAGMGTTYPWINRRDLVGAVFLGSDVSVRLNGVLIHDNFKLSLRRNKYAAYPEEPLSHIVLQEHGSPVRFRNIWLVENSESDR